MRSFSAMSQLLNSNIRCIEIDYKAVGMDMDDVE